MIFTFAAETVYRVSPLNGNETGGEGRRDGCKVNEHRRWRGGIYQLEGMERRLTVHGMMDTLNRGSSKRGLAFWTPARDHSVADIYALLMHRKHFASIAVTIDLIVYRRVNLQTTRFQHRNLHSFSPKLEAPFVRCVSYFFPLCTSIHPSLPPFSQTPVYPFPRISPSPPGTLADCQNVFINCSV